jgi:hypothetical protein
MIDVWILSQQISYLHDEFISKVTATTMSHLRPKVLVKNAMFSMSAEAGIVSNEMATLVNKHRNHLDMGQDMSPRWNLARLPWFDELVAIVEGKAATILGGTLGAALDSDGGAVGQAITSESFYLANPSPPGITREQNERIVRGIGTQCEAWDKAIVTFKAEFKPLCPIHAMTLMAETARVLRVVALAAIKLVEHDYRVGVGLRPIGGQLEARRAYRATIRENGTDLGAEVKAALLQIALKTEVKCKALLSDGEDGHEREPAHVAALMRMESRAELRRWWGDFGETDGEDNGS